MLTEGANVSTLNAGDGAIASNAAIVPTNNCKTPRLSLQPFRTNKTQPSKGCAVPVQDKWEL